MFSLAMKPRSYTDRLREEIAEGKALAIIGAGVSIGATRNAPAASWTGLLKDGVDRCQIVIGLSRDWADRVRAEIQSGDIDDLLSSAEKVSRKLGAPEGEFHRWLRESVGALVAQDKEVLKALQNLGLPLATTNYDDLLERTTGLEPVTWRDGHRVERLLRGDEQGILHLHGYWDRPESVVLGIRSYEEVRQAPHAQAVLRALRIFRTLIFIGYGEGLSDPNFGNFLTWTRECLAGTEYPHYRLCLESEVAALRAQQAKDEPIVLLPYGTEHLDLAPFLRSLTPSRSHEERPSEPIRTAPRLPPPPRCFGREEEVETLVRALCAEPPRPVPVLGPAGVGKTTVTIAALYKRRIAAKFGSRRFCIRCDGATSRDAIVGEIASNLGLQPAGGQLDERVFGELEREPCLLVLDNAEIPWWKDPEPVERLLAQLGGLQGLALMASIRGDQRPLGPNWTEAIRVGPLSLSAAKDAFADVAGERFRSDPVLDHLLEAVDRLPQAIILLANEAEADPDLTNLWARWQRRRTELLRHGSGTGRLDSLEVSLEMSIRSSRMTKAALRLLTLLSILPDGICHEDLPVLIPDEAEASATLRQVGLAFSQDNRLLVLATVRDHVSRLYKPSPEDLDRVRRFYLGLAESARQFGRENGVEVVQRLSPEIGNLETTIGDMLDGEKPMEAMVAVQGLAELFCFTGLGTSTCVKKALEVSRKHEEVDQAASCLLWLGDIALYRSNHAEARERYKEALELFRQIDSVLGLAKGNKRLGDIAIFHSDFRTARSHYEEALTLYRRVSNALGESNCLRRLGELALRRHDLAAARAHYEEALPLYHDSVLGKANCIKGLGDIALAGQDHDLANDKYEEALSLYRQIGVFSGEANCNEGLGDVALARREHAAARKLYEEALPLFRRVGDVLGEGNCIKRIGDIVLAQGERLAARSLFQEALALYSRIQEPYAIGKACVSLAKVADSPAERQRHIETAREAVQQHPELLAMLEKEISQGE
jgi:tetratricopeptide (TPR) repeat protein